MYQKLIPVNVDCHSSVCIYHDLFVHSSTDATNTLVGDRKGLLRSQYNEGCGLVVLAFNSSSLEAGTVRSL